MLCIDSHVVYAFTFQYPLFVIGLTAITVLMILVISRDFRLFSDFSDFSNFHDFSNVVADQPTSRCNSFVIEVQYY
jgi:hypothetical protein